MDSSWVLIFSSGLLQPPLFPELGSKVYLGELCLVSLLDHDLGLLNHDLGLLDFEMRFDYLATISI